MGDGTMNHAMCDEIMGEDDETIATLRAENAKLEASRDTWKGRAMVWAPTSKIREWEAREATAAAKGEPDV